LILGQILSSRQDVLAVQECRHINCVYVLPIKTPSQRFSFLKLSEQSGERSLQKYRMAATYSPISSAHRTSSIRLAENRFALLEIKSRQLD
jgi:hypothetical protein